MNEMITQSKTTPDQLPWLLKANEVAQVLRVSRRTVTNLIARGVLHPVRTSPRMMRFRRDDVLRILYRG